MTRHSSTMKLKVYLGFFIAIFLMKTSFSLFEEFAGPFYFRPKGVSKCDYEGQGLITGGIRLSRFNRSALSIIVNVTVPFPMDNNILIRIVLVSKGTNGYTWNIVLNTTKPFCDFANEFLQNFPYLKSNHSTKLQHLCVDPSGNVAYVIPLKEPFCNPMSEIPVFIYGDYRLEVSIYTKNGSSIVRQFCAWGYTEIRPAYETRGRCK